MTVGNHKHSEMRRTATLLLPVLIGTLLFNFLFWQEKMGLNCLIFSVFYVATLWYVFPESRQSRSFWATAIGTTLTAIMIVWHNSDAAKFTFVISAMCTAGFAQEPEIRQILRALLQYIAGWWQTPKNFFNALNAGADPGVKRRINLGKSLGLAVLPIIIATIFYLLYYAANDQFAAIADKFWAQIGAILSFDISWSHLFFILLGLFLVGAAFWRNQTPLADDELSEPDNLMHVRPPRKRYIVSNFMMGLKREYQQSVILLWLLNVLLLVVNGTDLFYVWFGFDEAVLSHLKEYVHEGSYILIISILLAMAVLFYVFRKNLNFLTGNKQLKTAAAIWLAQNGVLALSVAVRNSRYIEYHGLAYKRIGVILFLILVFVGLFTLHLKIRNCKTLAWLWRQNGWALYTVMVLNASISWDTFITRYNLSGAPKGAVDVHFMIYTLSDKNIYLLENNLTQLAQINMYPVMSALDIENAVIQKRGYFEAKMQQYTWKSWNAADMANAR